MVTIAFAAIAALAILAVTFPMTWKVAVLMAVLIRFGVTYGFEGSGFVFLFYRIAVVTQRRFIICLEKY
jgi:hypothetical protein